MKIKEKIQIIDKKILKQIEACSEADVLDIIKEECYKLDVDLYEYSDYLTTNTHMKYILGKYLARQNYDSQNIFKESLSDLF